MDMHAAFHPACKLHHDFVSGQEGCKSKETEDMLVQIIPPIILPNPAANKKMRSFRQGGNINPPPPASQRAQRCLFFNIIDCESS